MAMRSLFNSVTALCPGILSAQEDTLLMSERESACARVRRMARATIGAAMLLLGVTDASAEPLPWEQVDRIIEQKARAHLVPQIAVVVMRGEEVVHTFTRGAGPTGPTTVDTPFLVGSLSKLLTATAVMQLVDSGRVQLDAPVQQYLPQFRVADEAASKQITVRHLLNQNSGLPTRAPRAIGANLRLHDHVSALRETQLISKPGGDHEYSSPNYQVLGALVEQVTGQEFGEYLKTAIFAPLGMTHSFTRSSDATAAGLAAGRNIWFGFAGPAAYRFEADRLPTASVITSARDLGVLLAAHLGRGQYRGSRIFSEAAADLMHEGAADAGSFKYAMGLRESTTAGVPSLWHGGALPSYRGALVLMPEQNSSVVVLTNVSSLFADHTREIAAAIVAAMNDRPLPPPFRPLQQIYLLAAIGCLILLVMQVGGLVRAVRRQQPPAMVPTLIFDGALPLVLAVMIPKWVGLSWRGLFESAPDLTLVAMVLIALSLATGAIKLLRRPALLHRAQRTAAVS